MMLSVTVFAVGSVYHRYAEVLRDDNCSSAYFPSTF